MGIFQSPFIFEAKILFLFTHYITVMHLLPLMDILGIRYPWLLLNDLFFCFWISNQNLYSIFSVIKPYSLFHEFPFYYPFYSLDGSHTFLMGEISYSPPLRMHWVNKLLSILYRTLVNFIYSFINYYFYHHGFMYVYYTSGYNTMFYFCTSSFFFGHLELI